MIEFGLHFLQIEVVFCVGAPWQREQVVEVGILHRVVGRLRVQPLQFFQFFLEMSGFSLAPFHLLHAVLKFGDIVIAVAQLFLYGPDLLLQEVLALLL